MGCGSSAAGRLAAIALAVHFGRLDWTSERILEEASALEGHPDNASACWLGGFVTAACEGRQVHVARVVPPEEWRAIVVLPPSRWPPARRAPRCPKAIPAPTPWPTFSPRRCWGWPLPRRGPTCCAWGCRTDSPTLSRALLSLAAPAAAAGRRARHSGSGFERRGTLGSGNRRQRGECAGGFGCHPPGAGRRDGAGTQGCRFEPAGASQSFEAAMPD